MGTVHNIHEPWESGPPPEMDDGTPFASTADATPPTPHPYEPLVKVVPDDWYTTTPPKRSWLLRDARTPQADGVLPLGKVAQMIGEGGLSKTMAAIQLAVAVTTGTPWLGHLSVATQGDVLLLLGEEDGEESQRRIFRAARAAGATPPPGSMVVLPLFGIPCPMIEKTEAGNLTVSPFLHWLRTYVASKAFRLIIVDPTSRFAGLDAEKDNAAATVFVQALESIAISGPTVFSTHHVNKLSRGKEGTVTASSGRGSSAFVDGVRWQCALSAEEHELSDPDARARLGEVVTVSFTKSNYSRRGESIQLRRDADNGGALVPLDEEDRALLKEASGAAPSAGARQRATDAVNAKVREDAARVLAIVTAHPGIGTRQLRDKSKLGAQALGRATEALIEDGSIRDLVSMHGSREDHHYAPRDPS
jgi:hypothetical protein